MMTTRTVLAYPVALASLIALSGVAGCSAPSVVRPDLGDRPITVVPPAPGALPAEGPPPDLSFTEQLRHLLAETDQPVRLRVMAHPIEGDESTAALAVVCQDILSLAKTPTRFDLDDPMESDAAAEEARVLGVEPLGALPGSRRKRDPLPRDQAYRSLVIAVGQKLLVVPQVTTDRGDLEFQVAEAISRLLHGPRSVGLVTSEEEGARLGKLRKVLDRLELQQVDLSNPVPTKLASLVIVGPGKKLTKAEVDDLRGFLSLGDRSAALLLDGMEVEPGQKRYNVRHQASGLEDLLAEFGLSINRDLVHDNQCGRVSVPARIGRMLLPYPPIPTIAVDNREVVPDAHEVRLPFPSSLVAAERPGIEVTPLLSSSEGSWAEDKGFDLSPLRQWVKGPAGGPFLIGAVVERSVGPAAKLVVVANARFAEDQYIGVADNAVFLRQAVEWLGGHRALAEMLNRAEPSGATQPPPDDGEAQAD